MSNCPKRIVRIRRACDVNSLALVSAAGVEGAGEADGPEAGVEMGIESECKVEERNGRLEGPGVDISDTSSNAGVGNGGGGGASFSYGIYTLVCYAETADSSFTSAATRLLS